MNYLISALVVGAGIGLTSIAYAATEPTACPALYAPVCASHQVECIKAPCYPVYQTYSNECVATGENATVLHAGACTSTETGPIKPSAGAYVPPTSCTAWFDGCNSCAKQTNGGTICTMRACLVQGAGYCTMYASPAPPVVHPAPTPQPTPVATVTPSTSPIVLPHVEVHEGFFLSMWHWFQHLFTR